MFDLEADPYEQNNLSASTDPAVAAARTKLRKVLDSFPEDHALTGFPERYSATGKVPDLPAGSGKWKPFKTTPKVKDKTKDKDKGKDEAAAKADNPKRAARKAKKAREAGT